MKVINEGVSRWGTDPWWVGSTAECTNCKSESELERGDGVSIKTDRDGYEYAEFKCPTCSAFVVKYK